MDSQLLKKEYNKVFHVTYVNNPKIEFPKVIMEEFTNSTSSTIKIAHIPLPGSETYYLNGLMALKGSWVRTGTLVTLNFSVEKTDVVTAKYSY